MDEECNMPLCDFELEEDDNTEKQSETVEPEKKKEKGIRLAHLIVGGIYFTRIKEGKDGKERAKCNSCNKTYITCGRKYGTSHLNRHLMKCVKRKSEYVGQMILDMQGKLKAKKKKIKLYIGNCCLV